MSTSREEDAETRVPTNIELEAQLLGQEHRVAMIFWNAFWRSWWLPKKDPRRRSIWWAFVFNVLFAPATVSSGGILAIAVAVGTIWFAYKTDQKLGIQNQQQRAARVSQHFGQLFGQFMVQVDIEQGQVAEAEKNKLSAALATRARALSQICQPYRDVDQNGDLEEKPLSPERGTLIVSIVARGIDLGKAAPIDLSSADLRGAHLPEVKLRQTTLRDSSFANALLHKADLYEADLGNVDFTGADLSGANLAGADMRGANLSQAVLDQALLARAMVDAANLSGVQKLGESIDGAFVSDPSWLDELAAAPPDDYARSDWDLVELNPAEEFEKKALELGMTHKIVRRRAK